MAYNYVYDGGHPSNSIDLLVQKEKWIIRHGQTMTWFTSGAFFTCSDTSHDLQRTSHSLPGKYSHDH